MTTNNQAAINGIYLNDDKIIWNLIFPNISVVFIISIWNIAGTPCKQNGMRLSLKGP